jgi:hypothetical protein
MNKKSLSEADIRSKFITPALCGPEGAGWDLMTQVTIVRLPNGVFNPYTGIRTNLLFFTKGAPTREVWYYEHPYPPGAKSYNKGKPIRIEEFEAERA